MVPIIFFDGVCMLCNRFINFVFDKDKTAVFKFAALQGETAKRYLEPGMAEDMSTIIYIDEQGIHQRSAAVLRILVRMGGIYKLMGVFWIIPRPLRDAIYKWVANNRYTWFGKNDRCRVPTKEERGRILD